MMSYLALKLKSSECGIQTASKSRSPDSPGLYEPSGSRSEFRHNHLKVSDGAKEQTLTRTCNSESLAFVPFFPIQTAQVLSSSTVQDKNS